MHAFHDDTGLKTFVLGELAAHREADKLVKGQYWESGKGCAVGCTLEAVRLRHGKGASIDHSQHALYERELGIPLVLARMEDNFFERLPNELSQRWPERFINAIRPGADLSMIFPRFALWLLTEELPQRTTRYPKCTPALADVAALYREWIETGKSPDRSRWLTVRQTARDALATATATDADAYAYAYAYAYATATDADAYAYAYAATYAYAYAYAYAATYAYAYAYADAYADAAAAAYADAYADAAYADAYARSKAWVRRSDKLIELLEAA